MPRAQGAGPTRHWCYVNQTGRVSSSSPGKRRGVYFFHTGGGGAFGMWESFFSALSHLWVR